ncbi:MAG TPA: DapH/DapD/GlmU-related protein [Gallionellaceae bacterium]|nr:DapH/DapD/GlmU-related protein [Gallionellaceae bacterium]
MKLFRQRPRHKLKDILVYYAFVAKYKLDCKLSTAIFSLKCLLVGVSLKPGANVCGRFYLNRFPGSEISIGSNLEVVSSPYLYGLNIYSQSKIRTFFPSAKVKIGNNVAFNSICIMARSKTISIGNRTMIAGNCQIMDTDAHPVWPPESRWTYSGDEYDAPVIIGDDVYIGLNVIILKGVTIGDNSVIAAGSIVNRDIPPNCLAAGNPAKVVKIFTTEGV